MGVLIFIGIVWAAASLIRAISDRSEQTKAARERERIADEQRQMREEHRRQAEAIRAHDRAVREQREKQQAHDRALKQAQAERERLRKEQERQAKELARHEDMIARMTEQARKADADIEFLTTRIADLDYQLDFQLMTQAALLPGSKGFENCQGKIVKLRNQIHAAESQLANAEYRKAEAQRKLTQ